MKSKLVLALAATLVVSAQAWPQDASRARAAAVSCGPSNAHLKMMVSPAPLEVATPLHGKAMIYLISFFTGTIPRLRIELGADGTWVGMVQKSGHVAISLDPGIHHCCARIQEWPRRGAPHRRRRRQRCGRSTLLF